MHNANVLSLSTRGHVTLAVAPGGAVASRSHAFSIRDIAITRAGEGVVPRGYNYYRAGHD